MKFWFSLFILYSPCLFISLTCALLQSLPTSAHRGAKQINWKIWISFHLAWLTTRLFSSLPSAHNRPTFTHTAPSASSSYAYHCSEWDEGAQKYCHRIVYSNISRCRFGSPPLPHAGSGELCLSFIEEIKTSWQEKLQACVSACVRWGHNELNKKISVIGDINLWSILMSLRCNEMVVFHTADVLMRFYTTVLLTLKQWDWGCKTLTLFIYI